MSDLPIPWDPRRAPPWWRPFARVGGLRNHARWYEKEKRVHAIFVECLRLRIPMPPIPPTEYE